VSPARGWESRLHDAISRIEADEAGKYVLALYTAHQVANMPPSLSGKVYYIPYPPHLFFGSQAMYYPEAIRAEFSEYLKTNGVKSFDCPYDLLLGKYLQDTGVPLFAAIPCLFQHAGEFSTGLGDFHQASIFEPAV
jgi:hypothetical protein